MTTALRAALNRLRRRLWRLLFFRTLFGEASAGALRPATRLSPTVCIEHEDALALADDVFIGHFCFIEASAGVRIGRGTQVTNFVSMVSHSTHRAVRVAVHRLRKRYRQLLRAEIANTLSDEAMVDEEMRALFGAFVN